MVGGKPHKPRVFSSTAEARLFLKSGAAVTIGNFDGVHLGHRDILKKLVAAGKKAGLKTAVVTFDPHPVKVLSPALAPKLIQTRAQKLESLAAMGVDAVVLQGFDSDFAKISPERFFEEFLVGDLNARQIFVGYDFTFGSKRSGTIETLEVLAYQRGIALAIVPAKMSGTTLVSSSLIRRLIAEGDVTTAAKFLTGLFAIEGKIVHGHKRGVALGIHTANLKPVNELLPADGVYTTFATIGGRVYGGVTNVGFNPTFHNETRSVETHLFAFEGDVYGRDMRLEFVERLRGEIQFASPEALVIQIKKDIEKAKEILARRKGGAHG
jgi:riboflavin kinase/FMN adenylyltransferase